MRLHFRKLAINIMRTYIKSHISNKSNGILICLPYILIIVYFLILYTHLYQSEGVPERRIMIPGCVGIGGSAGDRVYLSVCVSVCLSVVRGGSRAADPPWRPALATRPGDPPWRPALATRPGDRPQRPTLATQPWRPRQRLSPPTHPRSYRDLVSVRYNTYIYMYI